MSVERSTLYKTAMSLISGYVSLLLNLNRICQIMVSGIRRPCLRFINAWDVDAIMAPRAPNCTQQVLPARLGRLSMDNEAYCQFFTAIMPMFKDLTLTAYDVVEDQKANKVVIHAGSTATTPLGEYKNEYMVLVETNDSHDQIVHVKEFVDSGFSEVLFAKAVAGPPSCTALATASYAVAAGAGVGDDDMTLEINLEAACGIVKVVRSYNKRATSMTRQ